RYPDPNGAAAQHPPRCDPTKDGIWRGGPVVGDRLSAHDFLAAPYSSILQRFAVVPLYDGDGGRQLAAQEDGGRLRRGGAALAGAFEGGDDPAGGEVYQGAQLVPVWPVGGPPEDAERRRDDAPHLELPAIHHAGGELAVVPRQGERVARPRPRLE